jgi:hypothetical protein
MDFFIKTEPLEPEANASECMLCDDGKKYYNLLIMHFQKKHKGDKIFLP